MLFLTPNQQCQSTEGNISAVRKRNKLQVVVHVMLKYITSKAYVFDKLYCYNSTCKCDSKNGENKEWTFWAHCQLFVRYT